MLPGVGVFGTGQTVRALVPLLQKEGFPVQAVWGHTQEEAESLAIELDIPFPPTRQMMCFYIQKSILSAY